MPLKERYRVTAAGVARTVDIAGTSQSESLLLLLLELCRRFFDFLLDFLLRSLLLLLCFCKSDVWQGGRCKP